MYEATDKVLLAETTQSGPEKNQHFSYFLCLNPLLWRIIPNRMYLLAQNSNEAKNRMYFVFIGAK